MMDLCICFLSDDPGIKIKGWDNLSVKVIIKDNYKCVQKMWRFLQLEIFGFFFPDFQYGLFM